MSRLQVSEILKKSWFLPLIVVAMILVLGLIANNPQDTTFWGSQLSEDDDEETWEISVYSTPCEPLERFNKDKPVEQITVKSSNDQYILTACVNVPREGITGYTEESVTILKQEWNNLLDIISSNQLSTFIPDFQEETADYGEWGFLISGTNPNVQNWNDPLQDEHGPSELMTEMAHIAEQHIEGLVFHYLTSIG